MNQFLSDLVAEYIYTRSPRQAAYMALVVGENEGMEKEVETAAKILSIFHVARDVFKNDANFLENDVELITFIDNRFSDVWIDMLEYASYRSYGRRYFRILFWAAEKGLLVSMDSASVLRGDLDEHFAEVIECAGMGESNEYFEWIMRE